ncbi:predicted protein [Chaetoceros tenuissimus]|uniref:F-box domain-containing protein n=1 Tax=Chaetoceros tenuissimus TaxID=426638 RepID=A0AAD3D5Z7_9STRA|nr:predicted protein [Chaetoceros tenuissimus]
MTPVANEYEANVVNNSNSTIPLPIHILRHCLSFLGSSDNYYFLAAVCKDFKTAVEQLYGENRNTSAESIIATVSTCNHVLVLLYEDTDLIEEERATYIWKFLLLVFENDRKDIFEGSFISFTESVIILKFMQLAIEYRSTEVMRLIIKDEENVQLMNAHFLENDHSLAVCAPIACDGSMIKQLIEYGVEFYGDSLFYALKRDDLDTFEYLLDEVEVYNEVERYTIISEALLHQKYRDAFQILMTNRFFHITDLETVLPVQIGQLHASLDLVQFALEKLMNEIEVDPIDDFFHNLIVSCISEKRMDILTYINTDVREIDVEYYIIYFEAKGDGESVEFLNGML